MKNNNYARACTETLKIIDLLSFEDSNKIPANIIKSLVANKDKSYSFEYDYSKDISEQNIDDLTRGLISNIFKNYIATNEEKNIIKKIEYAQFEVQETQKREKYNPDNLFKNKQRVVEEKIEETAIVEYKEDTIWTKIKRFLKGLFLKK